MTTWRQKHQAQTSQTFSVFPPTFTIHQSHLRPSSICCPTCLNPGLHLWYTRLHKTTCNSWLYAFSSVQDIESESGIQGSLLQSSNPTPCDSRALKAYHLRRVDIQAPFFHQTYQVYILNRFEVERIHSLPVSTYREVFKSVPPRHVDLPPFVSKFASQTSPRDRVVSSIAFILYRSRLCSLGVQQY